MTSRRRRLSTELLAQQSVYRLPDRHLGNFVSSAYKEGIPTDFAVIAVIPSDLESVPPHFNPLT